MLEKKFADQKFGGILRGLLEPLDEQSLKELKDYLGVSISAFRQWTNGYALPSSGNLIKLAKHFDVSVDYLLGLSTARNIKDAQGLVVSSETIEKDLNAMIERNRGALEIIEDLELSISFLRVVLCWDDEQLKEKILVAFRDLTFALAGLKGEGDEDDTLERMTNALQAMNWFHSLLESVYGKPLSDDSKKKYRKRLKKEVANNARTQN